MHSNDLLKQAIAAAIKAGEEILKIYRTADFYVETKSDNTPVTLADKAASKRILEMLSGSELPIISEEEAISPYDQRKNWDHFWLVDPLDGTKEFIKRNDEFAVNVALIEHNIPVIGVIYAPVLNTIYFARQGFGSYRVVLQGTGYDTSAPGWFETLTSYTEKLPLQKLPVNYTLVASRSHLSREVNERIAELKNLYGQVDVINVGSSIKQCWVAEGRAHEYPRFGTTMEWDTAAGQCILEEAGKKLIDLYTNAPMRYNKESMKNNFFAAKG